MAEAYDPLSYENLAMSVVTARMDREPLLRRRAAPARSSTAVS